MNTTLDEYKTAIKLYYDGQIALEAAKLEQASRTQRDGFQARRDKSGAKVATLEQGPGCVCYN